MEKLGDRLWIPHQVGLEFHQNRINVVVEQREFFSKTEMELGKLMDDLGKKVNAFSTRIAMDGSQVKGIDEDIRRMQARIGKMVVSASEAALFMRDVSSDQILARLEILIGDRVGEPMEPRELEDAKKEAKAACGRRYPAWLQGQGEV